MSGSLRLQIVFQYVLAFSFLISACKKDNSAPVAQIYFPPIGTDTWESVSASSLGWDTSELPALLDLLKNNGTRAFIILQHCPINGEIWPAYAE